MTVVETNEERDFFVWVDPGSFLVQANVTATGQFSSAELIDAEETLPFIKNDKFGGLVTPFLQSVTHNYGVEYSLEMARRRDFPSYPCRLTSVFLFDSEDDGQTYAGIHPQHVGNRVLQRVKTIGEYTCSLHDSSWIDYLRATPSLRAENLESMCGDYWSGRTTASYTLTSFGKPWEAEPLAEVLFQGTVEFYDRSFLRGPPSIGVARMVQIEPSDVMKEFLRKRGKSEPPGLD